MKKKNKKLEAQNELDVTRAEPTPEELAAAEKEKERQRLRKKLRHKRAMRFWDRLAGFIIVTVLVVGCACLGLEYVILKGPSPALRSMFISTMDETRRFRFIPQIFLTADELAAERSTAEAETDLATNKELITVAAKEENKSADHTDAYGLVDEDGDGIIFQEVKGNGYKGYMIVILDPTRVFVGKPDSYGGVGLTLEQMVEKYGALGGINAGGFKDDGGGGLGGEPEGLTIVDGVAFSLDSNTTEGFAGLDRNGILHVGFYSYEDCVANDIVHAVSFGPILISNGEPVEPPSSSVNPRTAIGQRADGAILMLVIDGRQVHSIGATYQDMIDLLLDYGAVNACNMDGGSSTIMYYGDQKINDGMTISVSRRMPTAWIVK